MLFKQIFLLPDSYSGEFSVYYRQPKGQPLGWEKGYRIVKVDNNGLALMQFEIPPNPIQDYIFYRVDKQGHRERLPMVDAVGLKETYRCVLGVSSAYQRLSGSVGRADSLANYELIQNQISGDLNDRYKRDSLLRSHYPYYQDIDPDVEDGWKPSPDKRPPLSHFTYPSPITKTGLT